MFFRKIFLLLCFLACKTVLGQNTNGQFRNFNINDGLSQTTVAHIFQDKKGFIWFTTSDGLNKFDGYTFIVYKYDHSNPNSLSENSIISILLEDFDNNLWVYTSDFVINKLNLKTQQFQRFFPDMKDSFHSKFAMGKIFGFEDSRKNIWISTASGLNRFDKIHNRFISYQSVPGNVNTLPANNILGIYEDSKGYVWILTGGGLCRYNESTDKMIRYAYNPDDSTSIATNYPMKLLEDKKKNVWVLTANGLDLFNREKNSFRRFDFIPNIPAKGNAKDYHIVFDGKNSIWIGTTNGLYKFDLLKMQYTCFKHNDADPASLSHNVITRLVIDPRGMLWIGTQKGLNKFNTQTSSFSRFFNKTDDADLNNIADIIPDKNNDIWVLSSFNHGVGAILNKLNPFNGKLEPYPSESNTTGIANIRLFNPFTDKTGNIWFGSFGEGVFKYSPVPANFELYTYTKNNQNALGGSSVWGMDEDREGNIWIALYGDGLDKFNPQTRQFQHFSPQKIGSKLPNYTILSVTTGINDDIWISTQGAGLLHYFIKTGRFEQIIAKPRSSNGLSSNYMCRTYLADNKLWIATTDAGIDILDLTTKVFTHLKSLPNNTNSLSSNEVWYIIQDRNHEFWLSCPQAIDRYNPKTGRFIHYRTKSSDSTGLLAGKALCIHEDTKGNIWFGTSTAGLSMFDRKTNKFRHWSEKDGMPNNVVYGILEDPQGDLWLSTNKGLSRFNISENKFTNYDVSSGLQSNEFSEFAFLKTRNNTLYFGGVNGFNVFRPNKIQKDSVAPVTVITGFQVFNKEVPVVSPATLKELGKYDPYRIIVNKKGIFLPENINYARELKLTYHEKVFTFEFAALNFDHPERIQYRYKMENFDQDWNYTDNRRFATYTNLPPGEYLFKVSAANADGVWNNNPTQLKVIILPPLWKTYWFILIEIISAVGLIMIVIWIRERELKLSKARLEKKVLARTREIAEKNEELELRNVQISKQKEEIEFQAKQLKVEMLVQNKTSEVALLQLQINPHFLFNTLNNIYSLVYQKADTAPQSVMKLSEIMRYMLYEASAEKVTLDMEIAYLNSYIELQMLRTKQKDFVRFTISGDYTGIMLAPMLLIPFVENAFKHGVKVKDNPGIIINLNIRERKINFEVINFSKKNDSTNKDKTGGIGLTNVKRRLDLLYCGRYTLEINKTDDAFHVKLELEAL